VSGPPVEQGGSRRAELVKKITELEALVRIQRDAGHKAGV
jgi:hypothetical protein